MARPRNLVIGVIAAALLGGVLWFGIAAMTRGNAGPAITNEIDLTGWKLTLPTANEKGTAASINPAVVASPWLIRNDDGSLTFWAPVNGATTPNSEHSRTELNSLHGFTAGSGPHTLSASVSVTQAPAEPQDIILGQIHGRDSIKSVPFVMLYYRAGAIEVVVKKKQSGSASNKYPLLSHVALGTRFDFTITDAGDGHLVFAATAGLDTRQVTVPVPDAFHDEPVRFQAGAYQLGDPSDDASDGARVTFHQLREGT